MFFETIYRWFASFFGGDMADFLSGFVCESEESEGGYFATNQFLMYGFIALGIALAVAAIFYFVNSPRFNKIGHWMLMLLLVGVSNFFIGAGMALGDLNAGEIGECLLNGGNGGVSAANCWMFGLANFFVSVIFFIIISVVIFNLLIGKFAIHNTCNVPIRFHKK
ncbi:hypothetical protein FACS189437_01770 [Bacteroidia bacterium]|nr:hypothetical protein FACS189437_01770 [Bacteroidia bacterium]